MILENLLCHCSEAFSSGILHVHKSTCPPQIHMYPPFPQCWENYVEVNSDVTEARGQSLIRKAKLKYVSERMFCLEPDPTHRAQSLQGCPISAEKCRSTSTERRAPEEACHQSSLLLQAGSSASSYLAEGRRRGENHDGQLIPLSYTLYFQRYEHCQTCAN